MLLSRGRRSMDVGGHDEGVAEAGFLSNGRVTEVDILSISDVEKELVLASE